MELSSKSPGSLIDCLGILGQIAWILGWTEPDRQPLLLLWCQYNLSAIVEGIFRFVWKLQLAELQALNDTALEANRLLKKPGESSSIFCFFLFVLSHLRKLL